VVSSDGGIRGCDTAVSYADSDVSEENDVSIFRVEKRNRFDLFGLTFVALLSPRFSVSFFLISPPSLSMALRSFGPWPVFQFLNPIHSR
jgi:hypothetical protein